MPVDSPTPAPWPRILSTRLSGPIDSGQVAEAAIGAWAEIDTALHGIIGHGGVAALFQRSLAVSSAQHPWLAQDSAGALGGDDLELWRTAIQRQAPAEAVAGAEALFQAFMTLLASLVGSSLTHRLLHTVWSHTTAASAEQDTPP